MTTILQLPDGCIEKIALQIIGKGDPTCVRVCIASREISDLFRPHLVALLESENVYDRFVSKAVENISKESLCKCLKNLCRKAGIKRSGTNDVLAERLRVSCERRCAITGLTHYYQAARAKDVTRKTRAEKVACRLERWRIADEWNRRHNEKEKKTPRTTSNTSIIPLIFWFNKSIYTPIPLSILDLLRS
jgi:hypothetical protein